MGICWDFPLLGTASLSGSNDAAITMFKGSGEMDGLAREVCQNSLDAKNRDLDESLPVRVRFELLYVKTANHSVFSEFKEIVNNASNYWKNNPLSTEKTMQFLETAQSMLARDSIPILVMSDYNTYGLSQQGDEQNPSFWDLLVNTEGISKKQDDNSAGSFGIGKRAPFAYSALRMVFYNTLSKENERAFEGVAHLVTSQRKYNEKLLKTVASGKYLFLEDEYSGRPIVPADGNSISLIDAFNRTEVGTDVAIVGFKEQEYPEWEKATAAAIIKNFILAIVRGKLEVEMVSPSCHIEINSSTVEKMLFLNYKDEEQLKFTRQIYQTLTEQPKNFRVAEKDDLSIYVRYDEHYIGAQSRFRSTGMLINTTMESLPHYSIVVVVNDVGTKDLSKTLREAEPPQHTEWKAKNIVDDPELRKKAKRYIREIRNAVQHTLDEFEQADYAETLDAGIGGYIPDATDETGGREGSDDLKIDVKIQDIKTDDGRTLYNQQYSSAESAEGKDQGGSGIKVGTKKRKKKKKVRIPVVKAEGGAHQPGVSQGNGKVIIKTPKLLDTRIYHKAGKKYCQYIKTEQAYDRVYIQYYADREDGKQDTLTIKNIKVGNDPLINVDNTKAGPISLVSGSNTIYIEFTTDEIMAVESVFTMEVVYE